MGICMAFGVGSISVKDEDLISKLKKSWKVDRLPETVNMDIYDRLDDRMLKNVFIFGEDPIGCAIDRAQTSELLSRAAFMVVQDYFMTETAKQAHLILPASFPVESGGSFTNTQKVIQEFGAEFSPAVEKTSLAQIADLLRAEGLEQSADHHEVLAEVVSLLPEGKEIVYSFCNTPGDNPNRLYEHGCDYIVKRFDEEFAASFETKNVENYERV